MKRFTQSLSKVFLTAFAACAAALSTTAFAQNAASRISYVTVDHPSAAAMTSVNGINDFDEFVGIYDDAQGKVHGFAGKRGGMRYTPIDYPGAAQTYVFRINDWGEMVGTYFDQAGYQHGFVRLPSLLTGWSAVYIPFDFPGAAKTMGIEFELGTGLGTSAGGLNNLGEITGQYADQNGVGHGFVLSLHGFTSYTASGSSQIPGFFGGSGVVAINDYGDLAGGYGSVNPYDPILLHGFVFSRGKQTTIDPPGSVFTQVFGINNSREVSGFFYDAYFVGHGYIYSKGKYLVVDVPGAVYVSTVGTVNNSGRFVGEFVDGLGITHGYIATRR